MNDGEAATYQGTTTSRSTLVSVLAPLGYRNVTTAFGPVTTMPGSLYGRYETRDY